MLILAVDTALQRCSVAIMRNGETLAVEIEDREKGHAERIAPMADTAFRKADVAPRDLDRIGVVVGPGGFTGVRVGLSFARAMGLAADAQVVGVASTEALAANQIREDALVAGVIDARRGQVYAGLYRVGATVLAPFVADPGAAAGELQRAAQSEIVMVGTGAELLPPDASWRIVETGMQIDPLVVARLAAATPTPLGPPATLYLRAPDAKPAKP